MILKLGTSKVDITPTVPVGLAGFVHRKEKTTEVYNELYVKTFVFRNDGKVIVLIIADLIWWDSTIVEQLRGDIETKYAVPRVHICFHATHTHSGPQISERFSEKLGKSCQNYVAYLESQVMTSIQEAMEQIEEVHVEFGKGTSDIGVYRRKKKNGRIQMMPNESVPVNDDLTVIRFSTDKGNEKAMFIHFSCHPTTTDVNVISSEYTGVCCEEI